MQNDLKAFQVKVQGKIVDYRLGKNIDLEEVNAFFEKKYRVKKLWAGGRHVLGELVKDNTALFLKLATTKGISALTQIEYAWNEQYTTVLPRDTSHFWVPQNYDSGFYQDTLFFLITDNIQGEPLAVRPEKTKISNTFISSIPDIIDFSEAIQRLQIDTLSEREDANGSDWFLQKTKAWFQGIPQHISETHQVNQLLEIVEHSLSLLEKRPRHGDFTPWHILKLRTGQFALLDGEHAMANGVAYYDIGYFMQRVFCVLENPTVAKGILALVIKRNYNIEKLQVILAARAIGGFLDESLKNFPNYTICDYFTDWVMNLPHYL
jgi:hypothetical protein